jgi:cytochrome c biogenesis factor
MELSGRSVFGLMTRQRLRSADASIAVILQAYNNLCARSCTLELVYAFALSPTRRMVLFVWIGLKPQGALPMLFRRPCRVEV